MSSISARALAIVLGCLLPAAAEAVSFEWNPGQSTPTPTGGTGSWDTTLTNWWNGSANVAWPSSGIDNDAVFGGTAGTVTISGGVASNDLSFTTTGYTITGGTLTLNGTTPTITAGTGISATISSGIAGTAGLTKAGVGTLRLSGANSLSGTVNVNAGTLELASGLSFATAPAINLGNTTGTDTATLNWINNSLPTNAALTIRSGSTGAKTVLVGSAVTGTAASLVLNDNLTKGNAGSLTISGATTLAGGNRTITVSGGTVNLNGVVGESGGARSLTKEGSGLLVLAGSNTFTGGVTVNAGTLRVTNSNGFGTGNKTITMQGGSRVIELSGGITLGSNLTWQLSSNSNDGTGLSSTSGNNTIQGKINFNFGNPALNISSSGSSTLTISGNVELVTTTRTLHLGGSSTNPNTVSGVISSNSAANVLPIIKQGEGTWVLSGANTYTGTTTINAGTLRITNAAGLGSTAAGTTVASGAALELFGGIAVGAETLSMAGTGVAGGGALRSVSGNNAYGGTITGTAAASIVADAGTLTLNGDVSSTFDTTFGGAGDIVAAGGLSAAGNVIKTGGGTLTLSVGNSQADTTVNAGQLNVNHLAALGTSAGTLTMAAATTLDNTSGSAVTITNPKSIALGSSLTFAGSNDLDLGTGTVTLAGNTAIDVAARVLTFSGDVVGTGFGITKNGAGTLRLDGLTGSGSFTGNSFVNAGTLLIEGTAVLGGGPSTVVTVADNAVLQIGPSAGLGDVTVVSRPGGVVTASVVNANQTFDQSGTLTTSNANFNGIQTIESGVTISSSANYLGTIPGTATPGRIVFQDTARLRATDDFTIGATQGISLQAGTATLETDAGKALLIPAIVAGGGGLRKVGAGNVRLTANNTYTGGTVVEAGILGISYGDSLGDVSGTLKLDGGTIVGAQTLSAPFISTVTIDPSRSFVLANGKTSGIDAQTGLALRYDGVLAEETLGGAAANLRVGSSTAREGTVILGGANTYTGTTAVDHGTLLVNGSLASASAVSVASGATLGGSGTIGGPTSILGGGILSPGTSPGTLTVNNTLALADTSILAFEINPTDQTIGSGINDLVTGVTDLRLGGTLNLSGTGSFTSVTPGTIWRLFNYTGTLTLGTLTIGTAPTLADGNSFDVDTSTGGQINLVVVPEPAGPILLAGLGLAAAGWLRLRRQRR